ncbi:hypothetical protein PENSPDRAFT_653207 [Peniophora sp. CONT]|nr:hypothetical protein PENSPDRAFT_653207 [Peniophora sp. CONT]
MPILCCSTAAFKQLRASSQSTKTSGNDTKARMPGGPPPSVVSVRHHSHYSYPISSSYSFCALRSHTGLRAPLVLLILDTHHTLCLPYLSHPSRLICVAHCIPSRKFDADYSRISQVCST